MKGGKDDVKVMGPLFPRLHVNDTEKGGPRAPPRNKMALYEKLGVPSHRFNSVSLTMPLPPHNRSNLGPSASSRQGGCCERSVFSPFCMPSAPAQSTEKRYFRSSDGLNSNGATVMDLDGEPLKSGSYKASNISGHLLLTSEHNSKCLLDLSHSKNSSGKKSTAEDDFCVPTYQRGADKRTLNSFAMHAGQSAVTVMNSPQKSIRANSKSSIQLQNAVELSSKQNNAIEIKLKIQGRNPREQSRKGTAANKQYTQKVITHSSVEEMKTAEVTNLINVHSFDRNTNATANEHCMSHARNSCLQKEGSVVSKNNIEADGMSVEPRCLNENCIAENGNNARGRSESGSKASLDNGHRSHDITESSVKGSEGQARMGNVDVNDDESETSMVDSILGLNISPDDVVGMIGQKHFWNARKAIANQQRIFAVQVFELHRLIKVQKLMAGSPELLVETNPCLSKPSPKVPAKKQTSDCNLQSQPLLNSKKDDSQKPSQNECPSSKENSQKASRLRPGSGNGVEGEFSNQKSNYGPYSGNMQPAPPTADNNTNPWCFPTPGNQWLVPIMSPSEGLVYKPVMGLCPPNMGFMAPVYGGCGPLSMPPVAGYGVRNSHQQPGVGGFPGAPMVAQNYFPPAYSLPVMNPTHPAPAAEQVKPSNGTQPDQQAKQVSTREVNFNMHSWSSCNISNQKSEAFSFSARRFRTSKESEVQCSSASSPCEREQGTGCNNVEDREGRDPVPLFPVGPAINGANLIPQIHNANQQTRVIKVVPHNARSASESAARIFRSIQKERQQYSSS